MTEEDLVGSVDAGRKFFAQKKKASLYAVAHAAVIACAAAPASAPQNARNWLRDALTKANSDVAADNKKLEADRKMGLAILKGKVTEEALAEDGVETSAAELARLHALAVLDDGEFRGRKLVKIRFDAAEDVDSTAVIRFIFELYSRIDAPLVSRYAMVLDWVRAQFEHLPAIDVEKVVGELQEAGGFEAVLHAQRERKGGGRGSGKTSGGKPAAKSAAQKSSKVIGHTAEDFRAETITVTMRLPPWMPELPEGYVNLYVICHGPEEVEVIGYDELDDVDLAKLRQSLREVRPVKPPMRAAQCRMKPTKSGPPPTDSAPETVD